MALNVFSKRKEAARVKKNCLSIPENLYTEPFDQIIASMDPFYLEDAVVYDFEKILPHRLAEDYRFFKLYPSWLDLIKRHLDDILSQFADMDDFKTFLIFFPEHSQEVYEYLLEQYLVNPNFIDGICMVDDILIPMADLERYQNYHFFIVREWAIDILDVTSTYGEIWDILQVLEQYFDMPREYFETYLQQEFKKTVNSFDEQNSSDVFYGIEDIETLKDFFKDEEAYCTFMDYLPTLIAHCGISLYAMMVKLLGPVKEVLDLHDYCAEFLPNEVEVND